jgi:nitrogen fixation/metabolism regulation signal transduction histidine kinase
MKRAHLTTEVSINNIKGAAFTENPEEEIAELKRREALVAEVMIGTGLLICLGLFAYGIKMTHKVAGPLFKVTGYFDKVKAGRYDTVYNLRKGDQLVEFYEHFKECHATLKKKEQEDIDRLRELIRAADAENLAKKSPEVGKELDNLREVLKHKEASLG